MDFKERSQKVKEIFNIYNRSNFMRYTLKEYNGQTKFCLNVDFALTQLNEELRFLLVKEYIERNNRNWWQLYYSKTTYYRIKGRALDEFLDCLKW